MGPAAAGEVGANKNSTQASERGSNSPERTAEAPGLQRTHIDEQAGIISHLARFPYRVTCAEFKRLLQVRADKRGPELVAFEVHVQAIGGVNLRPWLAIISEHFRKDIDKAEFWVLAGVVFNQFISGFDFLHLRPAGRIGSD